MRKTTYLLACAIACLFAIHCVLPTLEVADLERGLRDLGDQIASGMVEGRKQKIAVVEFSDLDGSVTELGQFLSEELITRLFASRRFDVVERQLLNKVLAEHKLTLTGLVDEKTAKELGKILGVDAICSGTITDLGDTVKINARLISAETGSLFAVSAVALRKDEVVRKLMNQSVLTAEQEVEAPVEERRVKKPSVVFLHEDLLGVKEGYLPEGWSGGEKLMTKKVGERKFITSFENSKEHKLMIGGVPLPDDFELIVVIDWGTGDSFWMDIGKVRSWFHISGDCKLNNTLVATESNRRNTIVNCRLVKKGDVFTLFANGQQVGMGRYADFQAPTAISLTFWHMNDFKLISIEGRSL